MVAIFNSVLVKCPNQSISTKYVSNIEFITFPLTTDCTVKKFDCHIAYFYNSTYPRSELINGHIIKLLKANHLQKGPYLSQIPIASLTENLEQSTAAPKAHKVYPILLCRATGK
jgi:hypothetical protein